MTRCRLIASDRSPTIWPTTSRSDYLWTLNFGPQHPATHTTLRLVLKLDGERVVDAMPDIGYLHSGFEKLGEHLDYNQYVTVTDRMNYISPMANNVAWHLAVEKLLGIELPPRCQYIRAIVCRAVPDQRPPAVQRRGGARHRARSRTFSTPSIRARSIYDIFETLCGARFTNSYTRVGGLMYDATPHGDRDDPRLRPQTSPRRSTTWSGCSNRNRIFVDRTKGVGVLTQGRGDQPQLHRARSPGPAA